MQRIRISANKRHFVLEDGTPFFWLADTAWELFHKLTPEETLFYLDQRAAQGFNVIQAVVLAELDGINSPNANGEKPLLNANPEQPNEAYFRPIDAVIRSAASRGLYIGLLPTWGDKVNKRYEWAAGPEIFNESNAYVYAHFLACRWRGEPNITWILGGDRNPDDRAEAIWRAMARGIIAADAEAVISFHPQPADGGSSSAWFHDEDWLGFNMLQTGHDRYTPVFEAITRDYERQPGKPVLNGEPTYEAHPLSFHVSNGYSTAADIRRDAYLSVLAGACGHTYGCHSIWQFHTGEGPGVNHPLLEWREALQLAGARQMNYLRRLMLSHAPLKRIPATDLLAGTDPGSARDRIIAARADDGSYALVYTAAGRKITLLGDVLAGVSLEACWMDPRDGTCTSPQTIPKMPRMEFTPPGDGFGDGQGADWVLIIRAT